MNPADWIRYSDRKHELVVEVLTIDWPSSHTPEEVWLIAKRIAKKSDEPFPSITEIQKSVLSDTRYFRICRTCSKINPAGWFIDEKQCHGCAEKIGIIF